MLEMTKLRVFGVGIVAANKKLDSHKIEVTPIEENPVIDGEITDNTVVEKVSSKDYIGSSISAEVNISNTLEATWMPIGSPNRFTAPDVRRGEYVIIYQYGDADKYYWVTFKDDLSLRKLETVIYAFSGTTKEADKVTPETHYFLEVSTHKKHVHFHTSKANNEPFAYDIQINTEKGFILIQDDIGNFFSIDSKERQIELKNTDSTHLDMNKVDFTLKVPNNTLIETGSNTTIKTGSNTKIETGGNTSVNTSGNTDITSGGTTTIMSGGSIAIMSLGGNTTMEGSGNMNIKMDNIDIKGNVTIEKLSSPNPIDCPSISGICARPY